MKKSWRCILFWTLFHCITRWSNFHSLFYFSWILSPFSHIEVSPVCTPLFMQLTLLSLVYAFPLAGASLDSVCLTFTLSFLTTLISFETLASWALVVQEDCESEGVFSLVVFFCSCLGFFFWTGTCLLLQAMVIVSSSYWSYYLPDALDSALNF